jgi:signal transduction histidine kinase
MNVVGRTGRWLNERMAAWVVSGIGLVLAGLSLWYLIVVKALYLGDSDPLGSLALALRVIEIGLLGGFSLVLVYAGYWLATSRFDSHRVWWTGLWTIIGLSGVVAIVALVQSFKIVQGQPLSRPSIIQEMLLAAGGGGIAGLLIGVSTIRETVNAERVRQQRDTLVFVNELLRHNVLNGMNVIQGNAHILREHVDEEGERYLDVSEERSERIVELIQNVRVLVRSVSKENDLAPVDVAAVVESEVGSARLSYDDATFHVETPEQARARADELLSAVFENLLSNAVEHNDTDDPTVEVTVESGDETVVVRVADDGPGIPDDHKETYFAPGEQDEDSVGQGIGLYLVETLVERYDGEIDVADNDPRGSVFTVELPRPTA